MPFCCGGWSSNYGGEFCRRSQLCVPQRVALPLCSLLLWRRVSTEVQPRLTDADLGALQPPPHISGSVPAVHSQNCHRSRAQEKEKRKKRAARRRTLGTFHSFLMIRIRPSKSRFHFLHAAHRGHGVIHQSAAQCKVQTFKLWGFKTKVWPPSGEKT